MPARLVPLAVGRTAVAVSGLADSGLVHRLTRGRLWIGALTTLLVGIVSLNVLALSFNASSSRVGTQADALDREISALRAKIATNGASNERVQAAAANLGLIVPEPGSVGYLRPRPDDAAVAAKRLASGELTTDPSYSAPAATVSLPTTTSTSPPETAPPAATQPAPTTPAADPATTPADPATTTTDPATTTTETTSPPATPSGGGGVSAP
jgi:cell division septation protein DedD